MIRRKLWLLLFITLAISVRAQTLEEGIKAVEYENYATARRILSKVIEQQPSNAQAHYYLGLVYCNTGKIDSARKVFTAGTLADPKAINNFIGIGRTYLEENNVQKATEFFDKARSLTSQKDVSYYLLTGDAYSSASHPNYDMAIQLLNKAVELNNKNAEAYWILGKTYEAIPNKGGEAVSNYERSTEFNPSYAKAFTRIGVIWVSALNVNLAEENFQKAIKADPNYPPAYRELAEFYNATGRKEKAAETFEKYLSMADKDDETEFRYGQFLYKTKQYQKALEVLNGLKTKISSPVLWRLLAYVNYELGNYEEALKDINTFFSKQDPSKIIPLDYEYFGKLHLKTGNDSLAALNIEKAVQLDSTKFTLYDTIANSYYKKANYSVAGRWYAEKVEHLLRNTPYKDVVSSYFNAGKAYAVAKEYTVADTFFKELTVVAPTWPIGYFWRARIYTNLDSQHPDSIKALAAPFYYLVIDKADTAVYKYRNELFEAYQYLGNINALHENYGASLYYLEKALAIKPDIEDLKQTFESVKENYKQSPSGSVTAMKEDAGYTFPVIINGREMNVLFDPGITGIAMTQEGSSQLFSDGQKGKIDIIKVGDRSLKNIPVTITEDLKKPVVIGADVLNKMNIVFDYATKALLVR